MGMCTDTSMDMCLDMCRDMCMDMCVDSNRIVGQYKLQLTYLHIFRRAPLHICTHTPEPMSEYRASSTCILCILVSMQMSGHMSEHLMTGHTALHEFDLSVCMAMNECMRSNACTCAHSLRTATCGDIGASVALGMCSGMRVGIDRCLDMC